MGYPMVNLGPCGPLHILNTHFQLEAAGASCGKVPCEPPALILHIEIMCAALLPA